MPRFARNLALGAMRKAIKNVEPAGNNALAVGGYVRSADPSGLADLKTRLTHHPLFVGTLIDPKARTTALVVRLGKTDEFLVKDSVNGAPQGRRRLRRPPRPASAGPRRPAGPPGGRVHQHRRRWSTAGDRGDGPDRPGHADGDPQSLWWALVPLMARVGGLAGGLLGPGDLPHEIVAFGRASGRADHRPDDAGGEPPGDPLPRPTEERRGRPGRGQVDPGRSVTSPILWCAATGGIGYGALVTSNVVPIRQFGWIMGLCTLLAALLVWDLSPAAMLPPFRLGRRADQAGPALEGGPGDGAGHGVGLSPSGSGRLRVGGDRPPALARHGSARPTRPTTSTPSSPGPGSWKTMQKVESRLGGIGVVELVVPALGTHHPGRPGEIPRGRAGPDRRPQGRDRGPRLRPLAGDDARPRSPDRGAAGGIGRPRILSEQARPDRWPRPRPSCSKGSSTPGRSRPGFWSA